MKPITKGLVGIVALALLGAGPGAPADVLRYAMTFRPISLAIPDLFPAGTSLDDGVGKTGAKPAIWADWAGFQAAAARLGEEGGKLADAALTGDKAKIAEQFASLGKNGCGGCHTPLPPKPPEQETI